jgi:hypothetical protein
MEGRSWHRRLRKRHSWLSLVAKSEDAPVEPFLDEWSKAEEFTPEWLEKMRAGFGSVT